MKTENEQTQGEGATQTAPNNEDQELDQDQMGLETDQLIIQDEVGESNPNENEQDEEEEAEESNTNENKQEQDDEDANKEDNGTDEAKDKESPSGKANNDANDDKKHRLSGAARKRLRYLISQGYSKEEAREKSLRPVTGGKRDGSPDSRSSKKGIKICVVLDKYPDELLSTEQLKSIQEAITDKILEMGPEATVKPKFHSSTHQQGWLAIVCADKPTMEWLKEIIPTIKPVEESSLKALEDSEMPYLETYVAFLPDSQDYSDEKILKLLEHQNDSFSVSNWKVVKKEMVEDELEVTFSIDRKHSVELKKAGYKACYKFGHVQLYPKEKEKKRSDSTERKDSGSGDSKRAKLSPRYNRRSPDRSEWKGEGRNYNNKKPDWKKQKRGGSGRGFRGSRANEFRAGGSNWSNNSSTRNNQSWFADPWKPWKNN